MNFFSVVYLNVFSVVFVFKCVARGRVPNMVF